MNYYLFQHKCNIMNYDLHHGSGDDNPWCINIDYFYIKDCSVFVYFIFIIILHFQSYFFHQLILFNFNSVCTFKLPFKCYFLFIFFNIYYTKYSIVLCKLMHLMLTFQSSSKGWVIQLNINSVKRNESRLFYYGQILEL